MRELDATGGVPEMSFPTATTPSDRWAHAQANDHHATVIRLQEENVQFTRETEALHGLLADASTVLHEIAVAATFLCRDAMAAHASACLARIGAGEALSDVSSSPTRKLDT